MFVNNFSRSNVEWGHNDLFCRKENDEKDLMFNVEEKLEKPLSLTKIPFNQLSIISKLDPKKHERLLEINLKFGGLCELICNRILIDDSLGTGKDLDSIKNRVTVERMDEKKIKKSHLLEVYSIFHRATALLFGLYPDNIFMYFDQIKLVIKKPDSDQRMINREVLEKGLNQLDEGEVIKLEVFSKNGLDFSGHSLLFKKMTKDNYIFFDPNTGEHRNLSFNQLCNHIDEQLTMFMGTDVLLIKGKKFLGRLLSK
jgi:hypothetical protein